MKSVIRVYMIIAFEENCLRSMSIITMDFLKIASLILLTNDFLSLYKNSERVLIRNI